VFGVPYYRIVNANAHRKRASNVREICAPRRPSPNATPPTPIAFRPKPAVIETRRSAGDPRLR
jgi:hypothetical protein